MSALADITTLFHQIIRRVVIVVFLVEDARDASPLYFHALPQALLQRLRAQCAVAGDGTGFAVIKEGYSPEPLKLQC